MKIYSHVPPIRHPLLPQYKCSTTIKTKWQKKKFRKFEKHQNLLKEKNQKKKT